MIYIKLFEAFIQEPVFYRFSHVDLLKGESELIYQPKSRMMIGPDIFNSCLVEAGFPDKKRCIHFMNSVAFDPSYKGLYGEHIYQIGLDENSKLGWSFLVPINDWFYKGNPFYHAKKNPILRELLDSGYDNLHHEEDLDKMRDILIGYGFIGAGTINDLKRNKFFENQPVFVWTNDEVKIKSYTYQKPQKEPKAYKNQPILTKSDFEKLSIDSNMIPLFYSSEFGKKIKRFKETAPFELRREEALNLLKKWKESL